MKAMIKKLKKKTTDVGTKAIKNSLITYLLSK